MLKIPLELTGEILSKGEEREKKIILGKKKKKQNYEPKEKTAKLQWGGYLKILMSHVERKLLYNNLQT